MRGKYNADVEFRQLVHILEKSKFFKGYVGQRDVWLIYTLFLPFSGFGLFVLHYTRLLANSQIFVDGIAGSVWIVRFLFSFDYL